MADTRAENRPQDQSDSQGHGQGHGQDQDPPPQSTWFRSPGTASQDGASESEPLLRRPDNHLSDYYLDNSFLKNTLMTLLVLFNAYALTWTTLLFVNLYVSIPRLQTPAAGFLEFDLSVVVLVNLCLAVIFFDKPNVGSLVLNYVTVALSALDLVLLLAVPSLARHHRNVVGVLSILNVAASALLITGVHYIALEWKRRLRAEVFADHASNFSPPTTWDRVRDWFSTSLEFSLRLASAGFLLLISFTILTRAIVGSHKPADGQLVPVGLHHYKLHIVCTPIDESVKHTNVTILADASYDDSSEFASWILDVQAQVKAPLQVCYWDRPGLGHSDSFPSPLSIGATADLLSEALNSVDHYGSFVLVSHGIGGLYSRVFASRHPSEVKALMLVDTVQEDLFSKRASWWRALRFLVHGIASPLFPSVYRHESYAHARLQELQSKDVSFSEVRVSNQLVAPSLPLVVASSSSSIKHDHSWSDAQRKLTKITDNNVAWSVLDGPHRLWTNEQARRKLQDLLTNLLEYYV